MLHIVSFISGTRKEFLGMVLCWKNQIKDGNPELKSQMGHGPLVIRFDFASSKPYSPIMNT